MRKLTLLLLAFAAPAFGQFSWPTYPVTAPIRQFVAVVDNGSGVAVQATGDGTYFAGVTQKAVVTSSGTVPLAVNGATQMLVGSTPVTLGELVTSDANGNAVPFAPASDGNQHCTLGSVIAGNVTAGGFIYINVNRFCYAKPTSGGSGITSVFGNTGPAITTLTVPTGDSLTPTGTGTVEANELTATVKTQTAGLTLSPLTGTTLNITGPLSMSFLDSASDGLSMIAGTLNLFDASGANEITMDTTADGGIGMTFFVTAPSDVFFFEGGPMQFAGQTSGVVSMTIPAVAGTVTNPVVFSNELATPTPATATSSTIVATTAFVKAQGYAPLASPAFTGTPTAPTAAVNTSTTQLATTAFVQNQLAAGSPLAVVNLTGQTGSIATTTLFTPTVSGMYRVDFYIAQNGGCSLVGTGSIAWSLGYTDDTGTIPQTQISTFPWVVSGQLPNNSFTQGASGPIDIYAVSGQPIQYSTAYTACGTGSAAYNIHITIHNG
jgi:hypothetical protein